jgi:hypothetical protein
MMKSLGMVLIGATASRTPWIESWASASFAFRANNAGIMNVPWSRATSGLRMLRTLLKLRRLLTELPFAPLHRQRSIVPNTWSQNVVLTP